MKRCTECGAINQDSDEACGVCGHTLSGVVSEELEQLTAANNPALAGSGQVHPGGLAALLAGLALVGWGSYEFAILRNGLGFVIIFIGLGMVALVFGAFAGPPLVGRRL